MPYCIFFCQFRIFFCISLEHFVPFCFSFCTCCIDFSDVCFYFFGNVECFIYIRPAQIFFCQFDFFITQRFAVSRCFALFVGRTVTDLCFDFDDGGFVGCFCFFDCSFDCSYIVAVSHFLCIPAVCFKTFQNIFRKSCCCIAFDCDVVAVIQYNQFVQTHCACQRSRFCSYTFLQTAVAAQCICVVVYYFEFGCVEFCCQMAFSQCHTNSVCNTLTQRACCYFNACCMFVFGVTGCQRVSLAEVLQVFDCQTIAEYMQQGVQQSRAVTCGQDESVSVVPVGVSGIYLHFFCPQCVSSGSCAQRQTGVTALCFLDCFCRQETQGIDCQIINVVHLFSSKNFVFIVFK